MNRRSFLLGAAGLAGSAIFADAMWTADPEKPSALPFRLTDVSNSAGIHFRHNSGAFGGKLLPETLGSGCAFLDYDGDGWQDILLINGMDWPGHRAQRGLDRRKRGRRTP